MNKFIRGVLSFICGAAGVLILLAGILGIGVSSSYHAESVLERIFSIISIVSIAIAFFVAASFLRKGKKFSIKEGKISFFSILFKGILIYLGIAIGACIIFFLANLFIK